ncbi:unnamed protein product [Effrenium voratum]|uniref:Uncharacterized protein n=1 Tax=Effrenium voratum TaxID=2562239 RepID=A0AA36I2N9_9DINO|nr:unnamed protein product [Effrenium voratum]
MVAAAAMAAAPAKATAIGIKLTAVEAVAQENIRGVKFHWAARSNTSCSASMGSVRPEDLSGVSLMLRCDTMAQLPAPAARQDPSGNVHLDNLRLAGARYGVFSTFACNKLELEWPTLMACPPCHPQDFAIQRTPCQEGQWRTVTFKLMRPCLGGMQAPPGYQETCDGKDVKSIVTHAGETVRQKYPLRALTFASVTVLLGCVLLCYATFLHRTKYRHLYMQDGGL